MHDPFGKKTCARDRAPTNQPHGFGEIPYCAFVIARPFKSEPSRTPRKTRTLIEIYWGQPISLVVSPEGDVKNFSTIEQAHYWLRRKWPVADAALDHAIERVEAAMDCMGTVGDARAAFLGAANTAGFMPFDASVRPLAA
ncbi:MULTISPECIES: DUF982 domain-containing protein [Thioclava]|uniref:DUF982 domain-containing protein n=1 Tax=Thioclava TaxID=285107 RepID=UPI001EE255C9|nr:MULTISPECIES: DUF982 domain-containing protein [Thioclava]